jgi:hypothetical protein
MAVRLEALDRDVGRERGCRVALTAIALLLGTGSLLSGCTAAPAYDPPAVYDYAYPDDGYLGFDYWDGWHDWRHHDHDFHEHGEHGH